MRRARIIHNPVSGRGDGEATAQALTERLQGAGWTCEGHATAGDGDAQRFAATAADDDADLIVAIGGDGTLFEVMAGLSEHRARTPVLLVPAGTTNAVARALDLPDDAEAACALLTGGCLVSLDAGHMPDKGREFLLMATIGYPARVATDARRDLKRRIGFFAYIWAALTNLRRLRPSPVTLELDGRTRRYQRVGGILVVNIGRLADPDIDPIPASDPNDGQLEVVVVGARSAWAWLRLAALALVGRATERAEVVVHRARRVEITSTTPLPMQCDGEDLGTTPLRAEVRRDALKLIASYEAAEAFGGSGGDGSEPLPWST